MASGDSLVQMAPQEAEFPATTGPGLDTRNNHPVLDFDASLSEVCYFSKVMPQHYAGGGVNVYLHTAYSSAVAGTGAWAAAFERVGEVLDIDADSFASDKYVFVPVPATAGYITVDSIGFSDGAEVDSLAVGETFRLRVMRDGATGADTATGDGELRFVEIREA